MAETRFTPGPWDVIDALECVFINDDEHRIYSVESEDTVCAICVLHHQDDTPANRALVEANARLIAESPALYALLVESQTSIGGDWRERRDKILAKVEGR